MHHLLLILESGVSMFDREEIQVAFAHRLVGMLQLELLGHRPADADETALGILEINPVGQVFEEGVQQVALLGQRLLGMLSFDGVADRAH